MKKLSTEEFVHKAKLIYGDKYDYSNTKYVNSQTKVCIICNKHGVFYQNPNNHLHGNGCPKCGQDKKVGKLKSDKETFIQKSIAVHGSKYDYSKIIYVNSKTKVCIICPIHGEFWQTPMQHTIGSECPKCAQVKRNKSQRLNTDEFVKKSILLHGDKYDYSKVNYINSTTKVCIICPIHGEFWQQPHVHIRGKGCPICGGSKRLTNSEFVNKSNDVHSRKYDYSNVNYINNHTKVKILCPKHGEFLQTPNDHLIGKGCPSCGQISSKAEDDIIEIISQCKPQKNNRKILNGKEIDVYVPSLKLGIEYNGLRWHSEQFGKDKHYHIEKLNECNKQGINLIQIFEDEWVNHHEICESKLKQICGLNHNLPKIFARKCTVREITNNEAKSFLDKNHIQGFSRSTVYLGCYSDNNLLIGVMAFKNNGNNKWYLNRFSTDINYQCIGVGGKIFKYFTNHYYYDEIITFADRRWTINKKNNLYTILGFKFYECTPPDYRYYKNGNFNRYHKFRFRKQILHKKYDLPLTMTENEMTKELGYTKIWDCGLIKYVYKKRVG